MADKVSGFSNVIVATFMHNFIEHSVFQDQDLDLGGTQHF